MRTAARHARWTVSVLAVALCAAAATASDRRLEAVEWKLDAGTTALLVEDHRAPLVSLRVEFPVGSWSPWARRSHLEEAFRIQLYDRAASLRRKADDLATGIGLIVADRRSTLHASCLKEDLDEMLGLVKEVLSNTDFDRHELRLWNRQRKLAWEAGLKSPYFAGAQAAARQLFHREDPRRWTWEKPEPVETDTAILAATRDLAVRLPGRVIGFAGDMTREEVERAVAGLLPPVSADVPEDLEPEYAPLRPVEERPDRTVVRLPRLTQVYFGYGRDSIPYDHEDYPAFLVANHVLGGHFYSRLLVALRHEGGETYGAGARSMGDVVVGLYGLATFTHTANADRTEAKLREVLRVFHESGITEDEREAAVGYLRGRRAFGRQSPDQVIARRLLEDRLGLEEGFLDRVADRAAELDLERINEFIARYYAPDAFSMVLVAPEE